MRQVAVLLGYEDPKILEVFKNIFPNRLHWVVFPAEDLRQAVETVRSLTKEKIDRQLLGQSAVTASFLEVSDNYKSSSKKAVSFNTSETNNKIDELTSFKSKMKVQMDKRDTQFNQKYIIVKEGDRIDAIILKMTTGQGIDPLVEAETHHTEVEEILVEIIDKIIEGDHKTIKGITIEETVIENIGTEIGVEIEPIAEVLIEIEKILGITIHKVEITLEIEIGQDNHGPNHKEKTEGGEIGQYQDQNQGPGLH